MVLPRMLSRRLLLKQSVVSRFAERNVYSRHPERSPAESKDPVGITFKIAPRDPSISLAMTARRPLSDRYFPTQR
jgi:hypothetical protein